MLAGLELLIVGKIVAAIKGAALLDPHTAAVIANSVVAVLQSQGMIAALQWLVTALGAYAALHGVVVALEKLIDALKAGKPREMLLRLTEVVENALKPAR